jgi:hypothetical protein
MAQPPSAPGLGGKRPVAVPISGGAPVTRSDAYHFRGRGSGCPAARAGNGVEVR